MEETADLLAGGKDPGIIDQFTEAMRYMPDSRRTWDAILRVVMDVTRGENCSLMLKGPENDALIIQAARGKGDLGLPGEENAFRKRFDLEAGVGAWVLKTGQGVYVSDVERDPRFVVIEGSPFRIGSLMCFPVRDGNQTVGIVNLSHGSKAAFGDREEQAMKIVSNQLAISLTTSLMSRQEASPGNGGDASAERGQTRSITSEGIKRHQVAIPGSGGSRHGDDLHFLYQSDKMIQIMEMIEQIADTDVTVLIQGESGVGKELIARALHYRSGRKNKPFIKINCAALPEELLESELFGYEKGAFTGAYTRKPGKFELAHGGTIFLDEIAEISSSLQAKLLQVLQDGEFARLGGKRDIQVSVRVLVATNKNLEEYVRLGRFREDLYYRLNVLNITVPPLRERREEILLLAEHLLHKCSQRYGKSAFAMSREVRDLLLAHDWPGNVRELENMIKRMVVLGDEEIIKRELRPHLSPSHLPEVRANEVEGQEAISLKEISRRAALEAERGVIQETLEKTHWNRKMAARLLGISYKALLYKIKECGLNGSPIP